MAYIRSNKRDITLDKLIDRSITEVTSDALEVGKYAFSRCSSLTSVNLPNAAIIQQNGFDSCEELKEVNLPKVTYIDKSGFYSCTKLPSINLPSIITLKNVAFAFCYRLASVSLSSSTKNDVIHFGSFVFNSSTDFHILIIRSNAVAVLDDPGSSLFNNTCFAKGKSGGTLYVPQSLVSSYQNDTNWQTVLGVNANNQILAIEGSPYEE